MMSSTEILEAVASGKIKPNEAKKLLSELNRPAGTLHCRVTRKGAVSVYGLQQMPVTLYAGQWERLLENCPAEHFVLAYIREWEGKEFHGESATERGGKKEKYTAKITRKAA